MRRISIALLAALLILGFHNAEHVFAITYAAGWNLVAGPEGSHLSGASGNIFTMQPGDTDYEVFPADSGLHGGWGYWANFPTGGSITLTGGSNTFSVASVPGQFIMIGNPSPSTVTISGADTAFTYTPSGGYQNATAIPPGQGAWVMGSQIGLAGNGPATAPAPVASAPQPTANTAQPQVVAATITTAGGLKSVGLTAADLPGFTFRSENVNDLRSFVASYSSDFVAPSSPTYGIIQQLAADTSASSAAGGPGILAQGFASDSKNTSYQSLGARGVGDEDAAATWIYTGDTRIFFEAFRRGNVVVTVISLSNVGSGSIDYVVSLARIIDARITGRTPTATTSTPITAPQSIGHLLTASGTGGADTQTFNLPSSGANVCVQVSGRSPSGQFGPTFALDFYRADGTISSFPTDFNSSACKIMHPDDGPGRYHLHIIATSWTNWTVTVDAQ